MLPSGITQCQRQFYRGTTFVFQTTFFRGVDGKGNRKPLDITGATIIFTAKRQLADADNNPNDIQVRSPTNIAITAPLLGTCIVTVPASMSAGFPPLEVRMDYDVTVIEASGRVSKPEVGTLVVTPTATMAIS